MRVTNDEENPVPRDILAAAIVKMSEAVQALRKSGVNEHAIIALVKDRTGLTKGDIALVLDALDGMRREYTR